MIPDHRLPILNPCFQILNLGLPILNPHYLTIFWLISKADFHLCRNQFSHKSIALVTFSSCFHYFRQVSKNNYTIFFNPRPAHDPPRGQKFYTKF